MLAIETIELTKVFGNFKAVDNVNLRVSRGVIFGLLGPNGAGKTTTLRMICGLLEPTRGEIYVLGHDVRRERKRVLRFIGYMPQRFSLYEDLTVYENLKFFASLYGIRGREAELRIRELLERFQLREYRNRLAGKLSGGTKQRLALAVALVHNPEILILDEPTAGVDPPLRRTFWRYFRELNREGVTILVTTHYMDEAEYCDKLALMFRGRIVAEGSPSEIKREVFGGEFVAVTLRSVDVQKAISLLEKFGSIADVESLGDVVKVKLLVKSAEVAVPEVVRCLEAQHITVLGCSSIHVSLEDVFVKLVEGST
ncbi:MAG: ABC transporter ATP-binding protein [Thermoprotei archaeon]|nr:MAG: ABC transporter ATP-binding protein [Thermoprotei archaeon]